MRVLVVTTVHVPLDARIHHRQIRALVDAEVAVTYAAPWRDTHTSPEEAIRGVRTLDLPRATGRRRVRPLRAARRLIAREAARHDLVLLHDPELVLAVVGRLRRLPPVVLDVHEDLVASLPDRPWMPAWLRPVARRGGTALERWAERHLRLLLAEARYQERFARTHPVVANVPWLPEAPPPAGTEERVVYLGRLSAGRGARELLRVGERLVAADGPALHLIGPVDAEVAGEVAGAVERGTVVAHGFVPNDRAFELVQGALAGLSLLHDLPNYRVSMPTKVVEYLANGVPAITTPLPEAAGLVSSSGGGAIVPFGDVQSVVDEILRLAGDRAAAARLGAAGREHVAAELSWDALAPAFVAHLRTIAKAQP